MVVKQHSVMCGFRPSAVLGRAHPEGSLFFATFFKFHRNAVKTHPSFLEQFRLVFSSSYSFKKKGMFVWKPVPRAFIYLNLNALKASASAPAVDLRNFCR